MKNYTTITFAELYRLNRRTENYKLLYEVLDATFGKYEAVPDNRFGGESEASFVGADEE
jgi:hypothetical protein